MKVVNLGVMLLGVVFVSYSTAQMQFTVPTKDNVEMIEYRGCPMKVIKGEVIIKFMENTGPLIIEDFIRGLPGKIYAIDDYEPNIYYVKLTQYEDYKSKLISIENSGIVKYAIPNAILTVASLPPGDEYFGNQWYLKNTGQAGGTVEADIDALGAWGITAGSSDIKVAILDSGIQYENGELTHPDLNNSSRIKLKRDWMDDHWGPFKDPTGHGTMVAGIIGAETDNNNEGIAGVTWNSELWIYKCQSTSELPPGESTVAILRSAILQATSDGADIINISSGCPSLTDSQKVYLGYAVGVADLNDVLIVAAAGNTSEQSPGTDVWWPAAFANSTVYENVIAVSATDNDDNFRDWSCRGPEITVAAPGGSQYPYDQDDIFSTLPTYLTYQDNSNYPKPIPSNDYGWWRGTSFAAPMVTGIAALVKSINNNLHDYEIKNIIINSAEDKGATGWDQYYGYGRVNAYGAVLLAGGQGEITYDMYWYKDCNLTQGEAYLYVDPGVTLTIAPGVTVTFNGDYPSGYTRLAVAGNLVADGTSGSRITFTSDAPGQWKFAGVYISALSDDRTSMTYCDVKYGYHGIWLHAVDPEVTIDHNRIYNCNSGIYFWRCPGDPATKKFNYNRVEDCLYGLYIYQTPYPNTGSMKFYRNTYFDNTTGARCYSFSSPSFERCLIESNNNGIWTALSSYPDLDYLDNSIKNNNNWDIWNQSGAEAIMARGNWWGIETYPHGPPKGFPNCGPLVWYEALSSPPSPVGARPLPGIRLVASNPTPPPSELAQFEHDFHNFSLEIHPKGELRAYLDNVINTTEDADVLDLARLHYWSAYEVDENLPSAVQGFETLIHDTTNEDIRKNSFFILGAIHAAELDEREIARNYFKYLFNNYPDDELSTAAHVLLMDDPATFRRPLSRPVVQTIAPSTVMVQNYPNPFNPETNIQFVLGKDTPVIMSIYNIRGRLVKTLVEKKMPAGVHMVHWNGRDDSNSQVPTGVYFLRFRAGSTVQTMKMVLIK